MRQILVLGIGLALGLGPVACAESGRTCIERVLREDKRAGRAENASEVVRQMRAIDMRSCPVDFRDAYMAHIQAWDRLGELTPAAQALNKPVEGFWDGLGKVAGSVLVGAAAVGASEEISTTFKTVERVAVHNGAALPQ